MKGSDDEAEQPDDIEGKPERDVKKPDLKSKHDEVQDEVEEEEEDQEQGNSD